MHDLHRGWVDGVAAKITQEVRVFFEHRHGAAGTGKQQAQHQPGRAAANDAAVGRIMHCRAALLLTTPLCKVQYYIEAGNFRRTIGDLQQKPRVKEAVAAVVFLAGKIKLSR